MVEDLTKYPKLIENCRFLQENRKHTQLVGIFKEKSSANLLPDKVNLVLYYEYFKYFYGEPRLLHLVC